jgi:hypothetical protein
LWKLAYVAVKRRTSADYLDEHGEHGPDSDDGGERSGSGDESGGDSKRGSGGSGSIAGRRRRPPSTLMGGWPDLASLQALARSISGEDPLPGGDGSGSGSGGGSGGSGGAEGAGVLISDSDDQSRDFEDLAELLDADEFHLGIAGIDVPHELRLASEDSNIDGFSF